MGAERTDSSAITIASPMNATNGAARWIASCVERTSVSSRIGPSSPNAPAASRNEPNRVSSSPSSRRIGISVPIAVVVSAEPVYKNDSTIPAAARMPPTAYAITVESSQPHPPSRIGLPWTRSKSISYPAKKNSIPRPRVAKNDTKVPRCTRPSTCGPMMIPSTSSRTTTGGA